MSLQPAVFIDGLPLSFDEAREIAAMLREPRRGKPEPTSEAVSAAVHIERLIDDFPASNPPMNNGEAFAVLLALARIMVATGLSARQQAVHDSLSARYLNP